MRTDGRPANILNKQSRTADKGWFSRLGVGRGAKKLVTVNNGPFTKVIHVPGPGMILWYDLDLQEVGWDGVIKTGLSWLRIGTGGGHL